MAVQNDLSTSLCKGMAKRGRIQQALAVTARFTFGRMMNEHDTEQPFVAQPYQPLHKP